MAIVQLARRVRSTVYGKLLTQGSDNAFYVGTDRTANARNWQVMAATETVSTELQSLTGSIRSRAHFETGYVQPEATCTHATVLPTPMYKPQPNGSFTILSVLDLSRGNSWWHECQYCRAYACYT